LKCLVFSLISLHFKVKPIWFFFFLQNLFDGFFAATAVNNDDAFLLPFHSWCYIDWTTLL
jgi:hypothetical protein